MEERAESSGTEPPPPEADPVGHLTTLQSTLTDLLDAIDDDVRRMDANLPEAHRLVEEIRSVIKKKVFNTDGLLSPSAYHDSHKAFQDARAEENKTYDVYTEDLECYQQRRTKSLGVAETDSDKSVLVERRDIYIRKLQAFHDVSAAILSYLRERSSSS